MTNCISGHFSLLIRYGCTPTESSILTITRLATMASPLSYLVYRSIIDMYNMFVTLSKELLLLQPSQTEREPAIPDIKVECSRYYGIMALSYDFDMLYYFCEEYNMSLSIK